MDGILIKTSLIYAIQHVESGSSYVGSTVNKSARWSTHKYDLRNNKHHSYLLQNAWNKYSEQGFRFIVLEELGQVSRKERIDAETRWIDKLGTYNLMQVSDDGASFEASASTKKKLSEIVRKHWANPESRAKRMTPQKLQHLANQSRKAWQDPDLRKKISDAQKKGWSDPKVKESHSQRAKLLQQDPEYRKRISNSLKAVWSDKNLRQRQSENTKAAYLVPGRKEQMSNATKHLWQDPVWRSRVLQARINTRNRNKLEEQS